MDTTEWAAKVAAAEAAGLLKHGGLLFLLTDKPAPAGRAGPVWADSHGHGWWVADRRSMVLIERRR